MNISSFGDAKTFILYVFTFCHVEDYHDFELVCHAFLTTCFIVHGSFLSPVPSTFVKVRLDVIGFCYLFPCKYKVLFLLNTIYSNATVMPSHNAIPSHKSLHHKNVEILFWGILPYSKAFILSRPPHIESRRSVQINKCRNCGQNTHQK
jgi:hypothetical protein